MNHGTVLFRMIGFAYNTDTKACKMFQNHPKPSLSKEKNSRIYLVESLDCLKDRHCSDKLPLCINMQCSPPQCAAGWTINADTEVCYKHFSEKKTLTDAKSSCKTAAPNNSTGALASVPDNSTRHLLTTLTTDQAWVDTLTANTILGMK